MARKRKAGAPGAIDPSLLDQLVGERRTMAEFEALVRQLKGQLLTRMLQGELTHHLGYRPGEAKPEGQTNQRNGATPKTVTADDDQFTVAVPRDREGSFEPVILPKHQRRLPRFDQNVISLYARGLSTREIQGHLEELYAIQISPDAISTVTEEVLDEIREWQQRPLDACYPVVILDALRVKIRDEGAVRTKAVYLALGIRTSGERELLGLWVEQTEGAAFWHRVLSELHNRGVEDILIALIDGLAGFAAAIERVFPQVQVHQCVVHLVRQSLTYVSWKDRKAVAAELRRIYRAPSEAAAREVLTAFAGGPWGAKYPSIVPSWERAWPYLAPALNLPTPVRRLLSTTNAIESLNRQLRKTIKTRGHFPSDDAALKLLYLAVRNISKDWKRGSREWASALPHLGLLFGDRFTPEPL